MELELASDPDDHNLLELDTGHLLERMTTRETTFTRWVGTSSPIQGRQMQLDALVRLIQEQPLLQHCMILSAEGYKQWNNGILHRFLVLELSREEKSPVWLRMDRRMYPDASRVLFVLAAGKSPAYDTVRRTQPPSNCLRLIGTDLPSGYLCSYEGRADP